MKTGLQIIAIIMVVLIGGFLGRVIPPFLSHLTNKADVAGPTLSAVPAPAKEEARPTPPATSDLVEIGAGFVAGNQYISLSPNARQKYIAGVIDGFLTSPAFGAPKTNTGWIERCIQGMSDQQIDTIVLGFLNEHPERTHYPMTIITYSAMKGACLK